MCFVLVCPEGAEAEMIQLARRWDPRVTGIYEHRPPIRAADVSAQCPVTTELRTFSPTLLPRLKPREEAWSGDVAGELKWAG